MNVSYYWYQMLEKPDWAPSPNVLGPIWTTLSLLFLVSIGRLLYLIHKKKIHVKALIPFGLNIFFNFIFMPLQFIARNNWLALFDIILMAATMVWTMITFYKKDKFSVVIQLPYLIWVLFSIVLQIAIVWMNR